MKKWMKFLPLVLAVLLLVTACGDRSDKKDTDDKDAGSDFDYNELIDEVTDRKVTDCITEDALGAALGFPVEYGGSHDAGEAWYQSEDATSVITLLLKKQSREEFDEMIAQSMATWLVADCEAQVAYWSEDRSQLVAYEDGYAVSVGVSASEDLSDGMLRIVEILLTNVQK